VTQGLGGGARPRQIDGLTAFKDQEQSAHSRWCGRLGPVEQVKKRVRRIGTRRNASRGASGVLCGGAL
jgi:hypothetical protein